MHIGEPVRIVERERTPRPIHVPDWPRPQPQPERIAVPDWPVRKPEPATLPDRER